MWNMMGGKELCLVYRKAPSIACQKADHLSILSFPTYSSLCWGQSYIERVSNKGNHMTATHIPIAPRCNIPAISKWCK